MLNPSIVLSFFLSFLWVYKKHIISDYSLFSHCLPR